MKTTVFSVYLSIIVWMRICKVNPVFLHFIIITKNALFRKDYEDNPDTRVSRRINKYEYEMNNKDTGKEQIIHSKFSSKIGLGYMT
jgi:hypothetical protein